MTISEALHDSSVDHLSSSPTIEEDVIIDSASLPENNTPPSPSNTDDAADGSSEDKGLRNRIEACNMVKREGNELFEKKDYENALKKYERAGQFLGVLFKSNEDKVHSTPIKLSLELNVAACHLKLRRYEEAVAHCTNALEVDPANIKALFRIGLCFVNQGRFEDAEKQFKKLLSLHPGNKEARAQLQKMREEQAQANKKQSQMFDGMFEKTEIYDDKKLEDIFQAKKHQQKRQRSQERRREASDTDETNAADDNDEDNEDGDDVVQTLRKRNQSKFSNNHKEDIAAAKHRHSHTSGSDGTKSSGVIVRLMGRLFENLGMEVDRNLYVPIIVAFVVFLVLLAVSFVYLLNAFAMAMISRRT